LEYLTSAQISEWEAYDKIDPIGKVRDDYWMTYLASLITNLTIQVNGKKGSKLTSPEEFLPVWAKEPEGEKRQSVEDMKSILMSIASAQNAKFKKGVKK
jgi:hypothetical protein